MLESEAPTHEERKAFVRGVRVVAGEEVARAARGGAVAGDGQQRALRAVRPRALRARRRPSRPPHPARRAARHHPLPTHWRR